MSNPTRITLQDAFREHYGNASQTLRAQALIAAKSVTLAATGQPDPGPQAYLGTPVDLIEAKHVKAAVATWYTAGLSPATITKRLNCLSKMGVSVEGQRPKRSSAPKWWLKDQDKAFLLAEPSVPQLMKRWIRWTTITGLRIEENLRLTRSSFEWDGVGLPMSVDVPGTKTLGSRATLPLGSDAAQLVRTYYEAMEEDYTAPFFDATYDELLAMWDYCRARLGVLDVPTATLKALRRNAVRYLHADQGMPLHMVQQYMRHEDINTTMGYLKLTGGYGTEELRRYLK